MTRVDAQGKRLFYTDAVTGEGREVHYDALLNTSPIDQFVAECTQICAPLRLEHNKAKGQTETMKSPNMFRW